MIIKVKSIGFDSFSFYIRELVNNLLNNFLEKVIFFV